VEARTYRTRLSLRLAMVAAAGFWATVVAVLARIPAVPWSTVVTALAFLAFFVLFSAHYQRMRIVVTPEGLVFRTVLRRIPIRWDEILRVDVHRGIAGTLYAVLTRRGCIQFTSLVARHRELLQLLLERGGLARSR
jgi:hypothetical protein